MPYRMPWPAEPSTPATPEGTEQAKIRGCLRRAAVRGAVPVPSFLGNPCLIGPESLPQPAVPPPLPPIAAPSRLQIWEHRIFVASLVLCASVFGVLLVALPWTSLWTANSFFMRHPEWLDAVNHPFLRGAVSGLGLLDLWIAFSEALGFRDVVSS